MSSYLDLINKKKREWNCSGLMDAAKSEKIDKLPFSSPLLNYSTYGGIPRNRITEFFGNPGGGKSTTAVDICKNAGKIFQNEYEANLDKLRIKAAKGDKISKAEFEDLQDLGPKRVLYVDLEHSFDSSWAKKLGITSEDPIDIMQPPDVVAEDILQTVQELIESDQLGLVVLDSIPSLTTKAELEKKYGERTVASLAGLLTIFCRKIVPILARYNTTLLLINQIRDNMDNPYVVNTPGGQALKFYCSLRIQFRIGAPVDFLGNELPQSTENPAGYIVTARIVKQKSAPWDRKSGTYYLMAQSGIRIDMDFAKLAVQQNIIRKAGAWFTLTDPYTGEILELEDGRIAKLNGMAKVYEFIQSNQTYYNRLRQYLTDFINGGNLEDPDKDKEENLEMMIPDDQIGETSYEGSSEEAGTEI